MTCGMMTGERSVIVCHHGDMVAGYDGIVPSDRKKGKTMGDRFVVGLREHGGAPTMYLYSHWGGEEQDQALAEALRAVLTEQREHDHDYANRIVVSQIVGPQWERGTGFGLSVDSYAEPDYDYINVVNWTTQKVHRISNGAEDNGTSLVDFVVKYYADTRGE